MNMLVWNQSAVNVNQMMGINGMQFASGEGSAPPPPVIPPHRGGGNAAIFALLAMRDSKAKE